jgi:hypothetical protein
LFVLALLHQKNHQEYGDWPHFIDNELQQVSPLPSRLFGTTPGDCSSTSAWMASSTRALYRRRNRCRRCAIHVALRASAANSLPINLMKRDASRRRERERQSLYAR